MFDLPISDARASLADAVNKAAKSPVSISKHGRPVAFLVNPSLFEKFLENVEELADIAVFDESDKDYNSAIPWESVKKDLGLV